MSRFSILRGVFSSNGCLIWLIYPGLKGFRGVGEIMLDAEAQTLGWEVMSSILAPRQFFS